MPDIAKTSNGFEIKSPTEIISADELRERLGTEFGIDGKSPEERAEQLRQLSVEGFAILIEYINKAVQGSEDSLMSHEQVIRIGDKNTIALEDRYDVFSALVDSIKRSSQDVNPERLADVLALGVVLLHPFHDGNGRTARVIGLIFRDNYDKEDYQIDYATVIEPRDEARTRGGFMIYGYTPRFNEGFDQSDPGQVIDYLKGLLTENHNGAYISCFGQASLKRT